MREDTMPLDEEQAEQLKALRAGDDRALSSLYRDNYTGVERYVLANSGTAEQAKDVYQDAFLACWKAIRSGKYQPRPGSSLPAYLYRIAQHKWLDYLRSGRFGKTLPIEDARVMDGAEETDDHAAQEERIRSVQLGFDKLGASCREVLSRFYYRKEPMRTIAEAMGWTEATTRNNKYRCIQQLRAYLNK